LWNDQLHFNQAFFERSIHLISSLILEIARVSVQRWLAAQMHVKHIASSLDATLLDQLDHTSHTLSFVDRISDHCVGPR
jgi:hypothetical protein